MPAPVRTTIWRASRSHPAICSSSSSATGARVAAHVSPTPIGDRNRAVVDRELEAQAGRYAALEDGQRRAIYAVVRGRHRPVTREEVAEAAGVSRSLAAFHLERLLDAGLVTADYARPEGRGGPGAGR